MDRVTSTASPRLAVIVLALAALGALLVPSGTAARAVLALPFLLMGPGLAWTGGFGRLNPGALFALAATLTLCIDILAATLLLYLGLWSAPLGLVLLLVAAAAGLLFARPVKPLAQVAQ